MCFGNSRKNIINISLRYMLQERQDFALRLRWGLTSLNFCRSVLGGFPKVPTPITMIIHSYDRRFFRKGLKLPLCSSNAMHVGIHYEGLACVDPGSGEPSWTKCSVPDWSSCARQLTKDEYSVVVLSLSRGKYYRGRLQSYSISGSTFYSANHHWWT